MGQLTCSEIRDMLADFSTGALGRRRGRQVKAHLHACPDCSRELRVLIGAAELLKEMPEADPPDGMWEGVLKAIAYVEPRPAPRRLALAPALGLAAAGAAVGVALWFGARSNVQNVVEAEAVPVSSVGFYFTTHRAGADENIMFSEAAIAPVVRSVDSGKEVRAKG